MQTHSAQVGFLRRHPLAILLGIAIGLRLLAVIFSKGFMASDDHYQTIRIVCEWLVNGPFGDNGYLTWAGKSSETIARNPLYTLLLYCVMKPMQSLGITSLDCMMYVVRALHGLLSLVAVVATYRIVRKVTQEIEWAFAAGLIAAAHFAIPFLSVRNLIEMVGANFWILSLWLLYKEDSRSNRALVCSGVWAGIAWMIRFQIGAAAIAIPIALWWQKRSFKAAATWLSGFGIVFLASGIFERLVLGRWWGGTLGHITQGMTEGSVYNTSPFIYVAVLAAVFFPPVSLIAGYLLLRAQNWKAHLPLLLSTFTFVALHTMQPSRMERYMIPVLYPLIIAGVLGFWYAAKSNRWFGRKVVLKWIGGYAFALNLLLLPLFTFNYGHKGEVEPLVRIQKRFPHSVLVYFSPDIPRIFPLDYLRLGSDPPRLRVADWQEYEEMVVPDSLGVGPYVSILYPPDTSRLGAYVDSLGRYFADPKLVDHVDPSTIDLLLHLANPKHNKTHEVWIYTSDSLTDYLRTKSELFYRDSRPQVTDSP